jgi:hypothetical protein
MAEWPERVTDCHDDVWVRGEDGLYTCVGDPSLTRRSLRGLADNWGPLEVVDAKSPGPLSDWEIDLLEAVDSKRDGANPVISFVDEHPGMTKLTTEQEDTISKVFETKDSGERQEFESGMVRDSDANKPMFELLYAEGLPFEEQMLTRWAHLMRRGAQKYGKRNWLKGNGPEELERARGSALRHMYQWLMGETDEDHAAAVMANVMFAEYFRYRIESGE